jgi:transcriptional regulator with XRE-family HTH domain
VATTPVHNFGMAATRIKELRLARGLSARMLAEQANVSSALISQVERDITDPSLETMRRIASVLEVPLFSLFQEEVLDQVAVIRRDQRLQITAPRGALAYTRATPGGSRLELLEGVLEPGKASSDTAWSHPSEECVVVLAGRLTVHVGADTHELGEGDSITFESRLPHRYSNESDAVARFLIAVTPPSY